ncbi:hypothetical protein MBANPS3_002134 [Mucor bainieri]
MEQQQQGQIQQLAEQSQRYRGTIRLAVCAICGSDGLSTSTRISIHLREIGACISIIMCESIV